MLTFNFSSQHYLNSVSTLQQYVFRRGINYSLDRFKSFLKKINHPEKHIAPVIHIAGTNGKGSTLAFIKHALISYGYQVGCYTSPHILSYCERIQINASPIAESCFSDLFDKVHAFQDSQNLLSEFEILTAMMFLYFAESSLDFVILETGLGGRYDATNVIEQPIATVITSIALDHQCILGEDITAISKEKLGIIKKNCPVFSTSYQEPIVIHLLKETAKKYTAPLQLAEKKTLALLSKLKGNYQEINFGLANIVIKHLLQKHHRNYDESKILNSTENIQHWGRFSVFSNGKNLSIIDGAHNASGLFALIESIKKNYPHEDFHLILGVLKRKNLDQLLNVTASFFSKIDYCDNWSEDSWSYADVKKRCLNYAIQPSFIELNAILQSKRNTLICGSFIFLAAIYPYLQKNHYNPVIQ